MNWTRHDLIDLQDLSKEEIEMILETAKSFKEVSSRNVKKVPALRGRTIATLFFEPSTRTRVSFELAAKRLSADYLDISVATSSVSKGESVLDMAKNIEAMNVDLIITRHQSAGVPYLLSKHLNASIVNAGDGCRAHPTQALLDVFTLKETFETLEGLKISIVGDIAHSRVARSNIYALNKLGAKVTLCGPPTLIPREVESLGAKVTYDFNQVLKESDVIMLLRLQKERQQQKLLPSIAEYAKVFGLDSKKLAKTKDNVVVMHPGPTNRGLEITAEVADGGKSVILDQVTNGIAVRMAILYLVLGVKES